MGRENIFEPTVGNESLHQDSNNNGAKIVNFATSKNVFVKSMTFSHRNLHTCKYTKTSPNGKTRNQNDHRMTDRRWHSSILECAMYDLSGELTVILMTIWWFVVFRERSLMGEIFNLTKLKDLEIRTQYQIEFTNRSAALENLSDGEDINKAWENITKNIKTSAKVSLGLHELKQQKLWFDEECLGFLDQKKQATMQWVQDPSQSNVDNLNNVRREARRHLRNKQKIYLKPKIDELENVSKIKNI